MRKNIRDILTYEYLVSVHKVKEVSEIMEETGACRTSVSNYLKKFGLSKKESRKGKTVGVNNPNWKGGSYTKPNGYKMVRVGVNTYKREHIFIMEEFIGRKILKGREVIHHLNGIRDDNRIENLVLMEKREHDRYHLIIKNKSLDYSKHDISDIVEILYPENNELKMYAELTRILKCKK